MQESSVDGCRWLMAQLESQGKSLYILAGKIGVSTFSITKILDLYNKISEKHKRPQKMG
jgi:hypothetical protein